MISLNECITDYSNIYLIKDNEYNRKPIFRWKTKEKKIYIKGFNFNEFIGDTLCLKRNIDSAHYFLVAISPRDNGHHTTYSRIKDKYYPIKIGSQDFKRNDMEYKEIDDFNIKGPHTLDSILERTNSLKNKEELKQQLLELLALDTYMGQKDRFNTNILFEQDNQGNLKLSPLYDFSFSLKTEYSNLNDIYDNEIEPLRTIEDYYAFIKKYPEFRDILKEYMDIDLIELIYNTINKNKFAVDSRLLEPYEYTHNSRMKVLEKIVR